MRKRKEIEENINKTLNRVKPNLALETTIALFQNWQMEVLLDIRDLLQNPPLEITGQPKEKKEE